MTKEKIVEAAEVARVEALKAPDHAYAAVFSTIFNAMLMEPFNMGNYTATGATLRYRDGGEMLP